MWAEVANIDSCQTTLSPKDGLEQAIWPKVGYSQIWNLLTTSTCPERPFFVQLDYLRVARQPGVPSFVTRPDFILNSVP